MKPEDQAAKRLADEQMNSGIGRGDLAMHTIRLLTESAAKDAEIARLTALNKDLMAGPVNNLLNDNIDQTKEIARLRAALVAINIRSDGPLQHMAIDVDEIATKALGGGG